MEEALGAEAGVAEAEDESLAEGEASAVEEEGLALLEAEGSEAGAAEVEGADCWSLPLLAKTAGPGGLNLLNPSAQISGNFTLS